ncbi:MAG: prepilin-type N-terminal cleavage/methylation domain-containing protein [Aquabacterium sp.]|nr:prepilin-type N-terminal cleavage/methylation domain-containing protein [Aquabacterium sp.]
MVHQPRSARSGFTLIELLVVLTIMATLLSIVAPRYFESVGRAKEATLKSDLRMLRECIDKYKADTGKYPEALSKLVEARYIHAIPVDPMTDRDDTWLIVPNPDGSTLGVYDIHSAAEGVGRDGKPFKQW